MEEVSKPQEFKEVEKPTVKKDTKVKIISGEKMESTINCLRNKKVIVRHVPKVSGLVSNPKHIYYGGMAENAIRYYTVPQLQSGKYVNVLTNDEKEFLEETMGLEVNALSIYKKENNYWDNFKIRLTKHDTVLDLSYPDDYIKYKVLLANEDMIAKSITTRFAIISFFILFIV